MTSKRERPTLPGDTRTGGIAGWPSLRHHVGPAGARAPAAPAGTGDIHAARRPPAPLRSPTRPRLRLPPGCGGGHGRHRAGGRAGQGPTLDGDEGRGGGSGAARAAPAATAVPVQRRGRSDGEAEEAIRDGGVFFYRRRRRLFFYGKRRGVEEIFTARCEGE